MTLPKPMPPKSKEQLTYVRDYFNRLKPQPEVAEEEERKSHLEKLKERMSLDEEKEKEVTEEIVVAPSETEVVQEPAAMKDELETEIAEAEDPVEDAKLSETADQEALKETEIEEKEAILAELLREKRRIEEEMAMKKAKEQDAIVSQEKAKESKTRQEEKAKESKPSKEVDTIVEVDKEVTSPPVVVQEEVEPEKQKQSATTQKKSVDTNSAKSVAESNSNSSTTTNIPQPPSEESPLETIRTESDELEKGKMVKIITGVKVNNALLYQDRQDLMNSINKDKVERLQTYLKSNPQHSVHIISHTDHLEPGLPEFMQYNTLKRANLIARYLMENGVTRDNISIESVSANYPLVKPVVSGQLNKDYLAYNRRIEFEILDEDNTILASHNIDGSSIPGFALDRKYELYSQIREELYYSVEIANSEHIFKNAVLRLYDDIYIRKNTPVAKNRYYIGVFNKYEEVLALQKELAESSAPYAEIKVFYQGQPVSKSDLKLLARDYPDLNAYLAGQE